MKQQLKQIPKQEYGGSDTTESQLKSVRRKHKKLVEKIEGRLQHYMDEGAEDKIREIKAIQKFQLYPKTGRVGVMVDMDKLERYDSFGNSLIPRELEIESVNFRNHVVAVKIE